MERIFIWGTGIIAKEVLEQCRIYMEYDILGFIDNDQEKIGGIFKGKKIFSPVILYKIRPDKIVILTDYYDEIRQQIIRMCPDMDSHIKNKNFFYIQSILRRYDKSNDLEIKNILEYIKRNDLQMFNYNFVDKYMNLDFQISFDSNCGMFYVYHQDKKLYFAKYLDSVSKVKEYYRCLLIEQDRESPHRYTEPDFNVEDGDVVLDIGAAEGIFSLEIIDKVSKIYIIEADNGWGEALRETFKNYQKKVSIIQKFIASTDEGEQSTLDSLIKESVNFIKMDIEGNEWDALLGAKALIHQSENLKCAICSYHSDFDEVLIKDVLREYGVKCSTTSGYLWFPVKLRKSYVSLKLCRGIVRGIKE